MDIGKQHPSIFPKTGKAGKKLQSINSHQCTFCCKKFPFKSTLKVHLRTHTGEKPFKCDFCGFAFSRKINLQVHMRKHTGEKPYQCHFCRMTFSQNCNLKAHIRKHTGEKPYICSNCGKAFSQNRNLKVHLRTHTKEKPYQCDFCELSFSHNEYLKVHLRKHNVKRPYQCNQKSYKCIPCNKNIPYKSRLKHHKTLHTYEKAFKCYLCGRAFPKKRDLLCHNRIHSGEKSYECIHCHMAFPTKSKLNRHLESHIGEKPFICNICYVPFSSKYSLARHMKRIHLKKVLSESNVALNTDSNESLILYDSNSFNEDSKDIDSIQYQGVESFSEKVSLIDNIFLSYEPFEECVMCYEKFDLTQITMILNIPIRARATCSNCRLITYTILSNNTHPSNAVAGWETQLDI